MPIFTMVSIGAQHRDIPSFDFNPSQIIGKSKKNHIRGSRPLLFVSVVT